VQLHYYREQAESLSQLDQEYWKERGGDQGLPHVHQWLQHVSAPTIQSEPFINDDMHSSESDDTGNSKRARLYSSTAAPRSIDNMAYSRPRSADQTDLRTAKDGLLINTNLIANSLMLMTCYFRPFCKK